MENDSKKSGEEFQRELLRLAVGSAGEAFDISVLLERGKVGAEVSGVLGDNDWQVPDLNMDCTTPDAKEVDRMRRFYDDVFDKYLRTNESEQIRQIVRFKDENVKWATAAITKDGKKPAFIFPQENTNADELNSHAYMVICPPVCLKYLNEKFTFWGLFWRETPMLLLKSLPVSEKWAAILMAAGLQGLNNRFSGADADGDYDELKKMVVQLTLANSLSKGGFNREILELMKRFKISKFGDFIRLMQDRRFRRVLERELGPTICTDEPGSEDEAIRRSDLFAHGFNMAISEKDYDQQDKVIAGVMEGRRLYGTLIKVFYGK